MGAIKCFLNLNGTNLFVLFRISTLMVLKVSFCYAAMITTHIDFLHISFSRESLCSNRYSKTGRVRPICGAYDKVFPGMLFRICLTYTGLTRKK